MYTTAGYVRLRGGRGKIQATFSYATIQSLLVSLPVSGGNAETFLVSAFGHSTSWLCFDLQAEDSIHQIYKNKSE